MCFVQSDGANICIFVPKLMTFFLKIERRIFGHRSLVIVGSLCLLGSPLPSCLFQFADFYMAFSPFSVPRRKCYCWAAFTNYKNSVQNGLGHSIDIKGGHISRDYMQQYKSCWPLHHVDARWVLHLYLTELWSIIQSQKYTYSGWNDFLPKFDWKSSAVMWKRSSDVGSC